MKKVKVDRAFDETGESWQGAWWNGWKLIWPQTKRVKVDMDMRKNMRKFTSFLIRSNPVCSLVWHPEDFYNILTVRIHMGFRSATSECFEIHLWDSLFTCELLQHLFSQVILPTFRSRNTQQPHWMSYSTMRPPWMITYTLQYVSVTTFRSLVFISPTVHGTYSYAYDVYQ